MASDTGTFSLATKAGRGGQRWHTANNLGTTALKRKGDLTTQRLQQLPPRKLDETPGRRVTRAAPRRRGRSKSPPAIRSTCPPDTLPLPLATLADQQEVEQQRFT
jgi:hypothetical protein